MRENPKLLQLLVDYWDQEFETFEIDGMSLNIEVEDIYFITCLSRRGEVVNLQSRGPGGKMTIKDYIAVYCLLDTEKVGIQILKNLVQNLGMKAILLALGRIAILESLHQASRPLIFFFSSRRRHTRYDWITTLLRNMKQ